MDPLLGALFFLVAILYSTVGHAGASGYLAVMGLVGVAPEVMRPTALLLNIAVAAFTTWRFRMAHELFPWMTCMPARDKGSWPRIIRYKPLNHFTFAFWTLRLTVRHSR